MDFLPDVRYWTEDLYCTIQIHLCDLEVKVKAKVKVTDFEILR